MKEYRNVVESGHKWRRLYDADLWIDGKFVLHVCLNETDYREALLMIKLETLLDKETLDEVKEVIQLNYHQGHEEGYEAAEDANWIK